MPARSTSSRTAEPLAAALLSDPDDVAARVALALRLLAKGILEQFRRSSREAAVVGVVRPEAGEDVPLALRQAQAHLARLALEAGEADTFSSVHLLLTNCQRPLAAWAPEAVRTYAPEVDLVFIDPDYRVPTTECELLASAAFGGIADLVENQLYADLRDGLAELPDGPAQDRAYTLVRQFIAEHPLATRAEHKELRGSPLLGDALARLLEATYESAHAAEAQAGSPRLVPRCAHCNARLSLAGECTLVSCRHLHPLPRAGTPVPLELALIARPALLKFWADPAQEELYLYRALQPLFSPGQVLLYPHQDRCDVAVGEEWGIDVKDHRDPLRLAALLNNSIGGLAYYPAGRRVLAIATRRADTPGYQRRLRQALRPDVRALLQVLSIKQTITLLKRYARA